MIMKRFNELLDFIGANKKKETIIIFVINLSIILVVVALTMLLKQIMIAFLGIIALVISNYMIFSNYFSKKKKILDDPVDKALEFTNKYK